jgi:uncharacterized protein (DUF1697 family)
MATRPARPAAPATPAGVHVALLRGVNVGGKNKVPMADLAVVFTEAGCSAVRTYIQSGNVVFTAPAEIVPGLAALLAEGIEARFGVRSPVVLRSAAELARVPEQSPFLATDGPERLHVMFLADLPASAAVAKLDGERSAPDRFVVVGREVHLHLPGGVARTRLTNDYFDRTLGTVSTMRNWNTVAKLIDMAQA